MKQQVENANGTVQARQLRLIGMTMITCETGNILESDTEAVVNAVNCVGVMGKGIALLFKRKYPENFDTYKQECEKGNVKPGKMLVFWTNNLYNPKFIINFPTKRHWREKSLLHDIEIGIQSLILEVQTHNIESIAIPALGCGNGGLNWEVVEPLIRRALANVKNVHVKLYPPQN